MTPVKRRHKSSQVLHFRYIVWRFLVDTFVMIVHWKGVSKTRSCFLYYNLCISEFDHFIFFFFHLSLAGLALLLSLWVLLWLKTTSTSPEGAMFNFDTNFDTFHRLVFCIQTTRKSSQVELETCREIWTSSN